MDITSLGGVTATLVNQAGTGDAVAIAVLKKANEMAGQSALQLLQALPVPPSSNPPNLGNSVNTFA